MELRLESHQDQVLSGHIELVEEQGGPGAGPEFFAESGEPLPEHIPFGAIAPESILTVKVCTRCAVSCQRTFQVKVTYDTPIATGLGCSQSCSLAYQEPLIATVRYPQHAPQMAHIEMKIATL